MAVAPCFYPVLLISFLAGLVSGSEGDTKSVCTGESIRLFNNMQINSSDIITKLYKNGDKFILIAFWDAKQTKILHENLLRDEHNNIWLINAHLSDEGSYVLIYDADHEFLQMEVKLTVLLAPGSTCKPMTVQSGMVLKSFLEDNECGIPQASVYWLEYPNVRHEGDDLILLQAGREAGTYYACIGGPSVRCTNRSFPSLDHCTAITVKESSSLSSTCDIVSKLDELLVMVALILFFLISFSIFFLQRKCKLILRKLCVSELRVNQRQYEETELRQIPEPEYEGTLISRSNDL